MEPWEVMISESQERMVAVVAPERLADVQEVCDRWELHAVVGDVTETELRAFWDGEIVGAIPARYLTDECPRYPVARTGREPEPEIEITGAASTAEALLELLGSDALRSRGFVYCRYDQLVQSRRCRPGLDAAVLRLRPSYRGLAVTLDGPGRIAVLDPFTAGALAVLEAARNVACVGGEPLGITDCLNLGNPEKAEVGWELAEAIEASRRRARRSACRSSPGTSPSTTTRTAARSCRRRSSAAWASSPTCGSSAGVAAGRQALPRLGRVSLVGSEYQARYSTTSGRPPQLDLDAEAFVRFLARRTGLLARPRRLRRRPRRRARRGGPLVGRRGELDLLTIQSPSSARAAAKRSSRYRPRLRADRARRSGLARSAPSGRYPARRERRRVAALLGRGRKLAMCGVFGVRSEARDVARLSYFGLFALQHRGQESAGIAVSDGGRITALREMGLVTQVFREESLRTARRGRDRPHALLDHRLERLEGSRSSAPERRDSSRSDTTGTSSTPRSCARAAWERRQARVGVRHRGDRRARRRRSSPLPEAVAARCAASRARIPSSPSRRRRWSHSATPLGVRPLSLGRIGEDWVVASETCALDLVGADWVRDVLPGEVIWVNGDRLHAAQAVPSTRGALCIFEHVYFARPDSRLAGTEVYGARVRMGEQLAAEAPAKADFVMPIPDSGTPAAIGFSKASGIPFEEGLIKNRYVHRTFIQPDQGLREQGIRLKFNPLADIAGRRIVVVDDSIVRGNTMRQLVAMLFEGGAAEVHVRVSSPQSCHRASTGSTWPTRTSSRPRTPLRRADA